MRPPVASGFRRTTVSGTTPGRSEGPSNPRQFVHHIRLTISAGSRLGSYAYRQRARSRTSREARSSWRARWSGSIAAARCNRCPLLPRPMRLRASRRMDSAWRSASTTARPPATATSGCTTSRGPPVEADLRERGSGNAGVGASRKDGDLRRSSRIPAPIHADIRRRQRGR